MKRRKRRKKRPPMMQGGSDPQKESQAACACLGVPVQPTIQGCTGCLQSTWGTHHYGTYRPSTTPPMGTRHYTNNPAFRAAPAKNQPFPSLALALRSTERPVVLVPAQPIQPAQRCVSRPVLRNCQFCDVNSSDASFASTPHVTTRDSQCNLTDYG